MDLRARSTPGTTTLEGFEVTAIEIPHKGGRTFGYRVTDGRVDDRLHVRPRSDRPRARDPTAWGPYHEAALALADGVDAARARRPVHGRRSSPAVAHFGHSAVDYAVDLGVLAGARARRCCSTTTRTAPTTSSTPSSAALRRPGRPGARRRRGHRPRPLAPVLALFCDARSRRTTPERMGEGVGAAPTMAAVPQDPVAPVSLRVGVLGCGNVGSALVELIGAQGAAIEARTGVHLEVVRVAVRDLTKSRPPGIDPALLTDDAHGLVSDPDVDLVVELIGGIDPARELILTALKAGKPVVTGNKALLATAGAELFEAAEDAGVDLLFEAAVAGGIPIIRPLRESLVGERITRVLGIVNGTTNFILTRMAEAGASYAEALAEAQALGYAEADPTADVEGYDAGAKVAIIASIAFGASVVADDVHHEGITAITPSRHRIGGSARLRDQAPGRGGAGAHRRDRRAGPPGDGSRRPPAGLGPGGVQRGVRRGHVRRRADVLRPGGRRWAHLQCSAGRPRRCRREPAKGSHASVGRLGQAAVSSIDDVVSAYYLELEVVDRARRALGGGRCARRARRVDPLDGAGGAGRRGQPHLHHAPRPRGRRPGHPRATWALDAVRRIGSVLRVVGDG